MLTFCTNKNAVYLMFPVYNTYIFTHKLNFPCCEDMYISHGIRPMA